MLIKKVLISATVALMISGCSSMNELVPLNKLQLTDEYHSDKPLVLFILDTSKSMDEYQDGETRLNNAKKSMINTINQMNKDKHNISLITFSQSFVLKDNLLNTGCQTNVLIAPTSNFDEVINKVYSVQAKGHTPLAKAIALSKTVVKNVNKKQIILLSDGKETCGGSAYQEAKSLYKEYGVNINLQVIGYAVDQKTKEELEAISSIGKGWKYHDAKDTKSLDKVINTIIVENDIIDKSVWVDNRHFVFEFDSGSIVLKDEYILTINKIYNYLKHNKQNIVIVGHTDSDGSDIINMQLSIERANIVKSELVKLGIDTNRIRTTGKGESKPLVNNNTDDGKRKNRRVEIEILD